MSIATFNDRVEFTAIKPHAPALRAIIDLDPLSLGKQQPDLAYRTKHPCRMSGRLC